MKIFPATALIPFLWLVPDTETRSSDDAPAREKAASPEKGEVVPWRRCTVYASPGSRVKEEASLFRIRVLRSPEGTACVLNGDRPFEVFPKDGTRLVFEEMKELPLLGNVREILDLERRDDSGNMMRLFSEYKKLPGTLTTPAPFRVNIIPSSSETGETSSCWKNHRTPVLPP